MDAAKKTAVFEPTTDSIAIPAIRDVIRVRSYLILGEDHLPFSKARKDVSRSILCCGSIDSASMG